MNDYCKTHWARYLAGNLESLWRIASNRNWLQGSKELEGYLTPDRIQEIEQLCRVEVLAAEMLQQLREFQLDKRLQEISVSSEAIEAFCRIQAQDRVSTKKRSPAEDRLDNCVVEALRSLGTVCENQVVEAFANAVKAYKQQEADAKGVLIWF